MADDRVLAEMPLLIADLYEAAGAARARGERIAARAGQTQARWQVLSVLSQGDWSVAQAARRLGVARQGVQRLVNELELAGLVRYEPNPRHLRSPLVRLSDDGHAVLAQITGAARGWHRTAAEQLSLADVLTTRAILRRLIAAARYLPVRDPGAALENEDHRRKKRGGRPPRGIAPTPRSSASSTTVAARRLRADGAGRGGVDR
jgi:DNA-binding MarR family transcriptional regulator